jgi:hypothetical protein
MFLKKKYNTVILGAALLWSCSKPAMNVPQPKKDEQGKAYFSNPQDLVNWVDHNDQIVRKRVMGDFEFSLKRLSPDLLALQELQGNTSNAVAFEEAKSHYTGLTYFRLNIQNKNFHKELLQYNVNSNEEYTRRLDYYAFELNNDLSLDDGKNIVPCAIHQFERTFNIESGLNFMIAFTAEKPEGGYTVSLDDKIFKNGIIKFSFTKGNDIPYIKIK